MLDDQLVVHVEKERTHSITVVICAYTEDRWVTLQHAVARVHKQMSAGDELLVVVDYNEALLARCRESMDQCIIISNGHLRGLSGARNTAIEEARGSIIVFLDDDAIPLDGWLDALRAPYADKRVHGVGGLTIPRWLAGQPGWFPEEFLWVVGCSHLGLPTVSRPVRNLIGANMSFRRSAFEHVGGFVEGMGRIGTRPLGCEETEFSIRLTQARPEVILLFDPAAEVEHHVPRQRGSLRYFTRRCWSEGLSKSEVSRRVGRSSALSVESHYASRVLPRGVWHGLHDTASGDIWGAARSVAIVLGFIVTVAGYWIGALRRLPYSGGEVK